MNLDDVAYLFVEQYENIHGFYSEEYKRSDVDLIRRTAERGESALYTLAATLFANRLDDVLVGAANGAMDYIAYVDETWVPENAEDKVKTLALEAKHLESLEAILRMAQLTESGVAKEIESIMAVAKIHYQKLEEREIGI